MMNEQDQAHEDDAGIVDALETTTDESVWIVDSLAFGRKLTTCTFTRG